MPGFEDAKGQPVQFKLNCDGLRDDAIAHSDFKWNAEWEGKVHQDGRNWSATFKIPFANFGVTPKLGEQWEANLGVYLQGYDYRAFLWSPVAAGHHHSGDFGRFPNHGAGSIACPQHAIAQDQLRVPSTLTPSTRSPGSPECG